MTTALPSTDIGRARLDMLADLMLANADNPVGARYYVGKWGRTDAGFGKGAPLTCNTTVCALGLAAISGKFEDAGLIYTLQYGGRISIYHTDEKKMDALKDEYPMSAYPVFAAMLTFDLTYKEAVRLFSPPIVDVLGGTGAEAEKAHAAIIKNFIAGVSLSPSADGT